MTAKDSGATETVTNRALAAKAMMVGVLRTKTNSLTTISDTAEIAIQNAAETGGGLKDVATGLLQGAILCAQELGVSVQEAAASAADGALKGAHAVNSTAFDIVRSAVTQIIYGVKVGMKGTYSTPMHSFPPLTLAAPDALALAVIEGEDRLSR